MNKEKTAVLVQMGLATIFAVLYAAAVRFCNAGFAQTQTPTLVSTLLLAAVLLAAGGCLLRRREEIPESAVSLVIWMGVLIRILHVAYTPVGFFQNDLGMFAPDNYGNMGYVYYLYTYGTLPDVNPMSHYQFYHPPLHFAVCALLLRVAAFFGGDIGRMGVRYLQILPLVYSALTLLYFDKTAKKMKVPVTGRFLAVCAVAFLPYQILLSGAVNNDPPVLLFMVMSVYYALVWYEEPTALHIFQLALAIGLGMMTKIFAALVAPGIGVLMLMRAFQSRAEWKRYLGQFCFFATVVFPLGLWYAVLRYVQFRMPLTYAPGLPEDSIQNISRYSVWERFFDFSGAFTVPYIQWDRQEAFADHNIFTTLVKYAVFGEADYSRVADTVRVVSVLMLWATMVLLLLLLAGIVLFLGDQTIAVHVRTLVLVCIAVIFAMYVKFCLEFTFICAMNIRYILAAIYLGMLAMGYGFSGVIRRLEAGNRKAGKVLRISLAALFWIYVTGSILLEFNLDVLM